MTLRKLCRGKGRIEPLLPSVALWINRGEGEAEEKEDFLGRWDFEGREH